jgi:diguanylate cyclase (GGDEF)-like protein
MQFVDLRTVVALSGILAGLMSLVLFALRRNYPASIRGLGQWAWALLLFFAAGLLAAKRDALPALITINVASAMLWAGCYVCYAGSRMFFDRPVRHRPWLAVMVLLMAAQIWFTQVEPDYRVRMVLTTGLIGCISALHGRLILRQPSLSLARGMAVLVMAALTVLQAARLTTAFNSQAQADFYGDDPWHTIYLTGLSLSVLLFAISMVLMASDRLRAELEHLASRDSLTDALTRRHITTACHAELERCRRNGRQMALLIMDLDHFKAINDTHGHQTGDAVLVWFVNRVRSVLRPADQLGRFGGEEFVALLPEVSRQEACVVAERIRAIAQLDAPVAGCSVSIGIAVSHGPDDSVDLLLARADTALYLAKANGRNRSELALDSAA